LKIMSKISGGFFRRNFRGQKHAKFGTILDDFKVRRRISSEQIKILKIGQEFDLLRFLLRFVYANAFYFRPCDFAPNF